MIKQTLREAILDLVRENLTNKTFTNCLKHKVETPLLTEITSLKESYVGYMDQSLIEVSWSCGCKTHIPFQEFTQYLFYKFNVF